MSSRIHLSKDGRFYLIDGSRYSRVTDVISATIRRKQLEEWKQRVGKEEAERVANETSAYGERLHEMLAWHDRGNMRMVDAMLRETIEFLPSVNVWSTWATKWIKKWLIIEGILFSPKLRIAGRVDRVGEFKGDDAPCVGDFKTGTTVYDETGIQLGLYKHIYNETHTPKAKRTLTFHLPRVDPGKLTIKEYVGKKYEESGLAAVKIFHTLHKK
jgi:hypothetical protein